MKKRKPSEWTQEERDRIVGFFALLIKVDKRTNPHLYEVKKKGPLSDETIKSLTDLGGVLRQIHNRLVSEGKVEVRDGKVIFLEKK